MDSTTKFMNCLQEAEQAEQEGNVVDIEMNQ